MCLPVKGKRQVIVSSQYQTLPYNLLYLIIIANDFSHKCKKNHTCCVFHASRFFFVKKMIKSILNPFNYIEKNHLCMRADMPLVSFFRESKSVQIMRSLMTWRTTSLMVRCALIIATDPVTLSVYTSNFSPHTGVTCFIYIWARMGMVRKSMHNHIMVTL